MVLYFFVNPEDYDFFNEGDALAIDGFADAVAWANAEGIITGKKNGDAVTLAPLDKAQRSETATMFARFHKTFVR